MQNILIVSFYLAISGIALANGFSETRFTSATQNDFFDVSQICDASLEASQSDEVASLDFHRLYRANGMCLDGFRGNYCYTLIYNMTSRQCESAIYTKQNGYSVELVSQKSGAAIRFNTSSNHPVITLETAGGAVALVEYVNHVEVINIENNPNIGVR